MRHTRYNKFFSVGCLVSKPMSNFSNWPHALAIYEVNAENSFVNDAPDLKMVSPSPLPHLEILTTPIAHRMTSKQGLPKAQDVPRFYSFVILVALVESLASVARSMPIAHS